MLGRRTDHDERHRHTPDQIVHKLHKGERLLNEGKDITEVVRHLEIAEVAGAARVVRTTSWRFSWRASAARAIARWATDRRASFRA